jgi:hypothetical protein
MTSVKKDAKQEDEVTIISKNEIDQPGPNRGAMSGIDNPLVA